MMAERRIIPTFNIYKTLGSEVSFIFSNLEETYNPYDASSPHRHNYYEILLFLKSGGTHEIDFNVYPIQKNSLHCISPEQVHLLKREPHVNGYVLSFTKEIFLEESTGITFIDRFPFFDNPYAIPVVQMNDVEQQKIIFDIVTKIQSEYLSENQDKDEALYSYLSILLIAVRRMYASENIHGTLVSQRTELTHKFKKLVDKDFRQNKSVSDYAKLLNISAGHLSDTVQKDTGKTASEIIHERIILEAKRLLYHSPKSVKEIAFELNYDNPSYFNRFFKTHAEMTPEQFRKHIREKYH